MNLRHFRFRSARTGRYVSATEAHANQDTTVSERQRAALPPEVISAAQNCIQRNGIEGTLERLAD